MNEVKSLVDERRRKSSYMAICVCGCVRVHLNTYAHPYNMGPLMGMGLVRDATFIINDEQSPNPVGDRRGTSKDRQSGGCLTCLLSPAGWQ